MEICHLNILLHSPTWMNLTHVVKYISGVTSFDISIQLDRNDPNKFSLISLNHPLPRLTLVYKQTVGLPMIWDAMTVMWRADMLWWYLGLTVPNHTMWYRIAYIGEPKPKSKDLEQTYMIKSVPVKGKSLFNVWSHLRDQLYGLYFE